MIFMNKDVLVYVNKCEGWKTAIKELHWDSKSLSQHELCDKIADAIADHQDKVSEVEQSMSGKLPIGNLKPVPYKVVSLKKFIDDIIFDTKSFLKKIEKMGDDYIGMKSDCESFISDIQRDLYLVNFTENKRSFNISEDRVRGIIRESIENLLGYNV